jgi:hypothetical protein
MNHDALCELLHRPNWQVALIESGGGHPCQCVARTGPAKVLALRAALTHPSSGHHLSAALARAAR